MWEARWVDSDRTAQALDVARRAAGFLAVHEVTALTPDVRVLDPGSVLIGAGVSVLPGAVLYPSTTLETRDGGLISVASGARLGPGPVTVVASAATVHIGEGAELGPGPVTVVADSSGRSPTTDDGETRTPGRTAINSPRRTRRCRARRSALGLPVVRMRGMVRARSSMDQPSIAGPDHGAAVSRSVDDESGLQAVEG
jgi:hypothetical protein